MANKRTKGARRLAVWIGDRGKIDVAARLGVSPADLSRWLHGHRLPSLTRAVEIEKLTRGEVPARAWVT